MAKDYTNQLIAESRNDVNHKADYTEKCRCWGKCWDEYKEQTKNMTMTKFKRLFGTKEFNECTSESPDPNQKICNSCSHSSSGCYGKKICPQQLKPAQIIVTKVYYGPWRDFLVTETGIWTTIVCPVCGYSEFWSVGDGDERF
ncbi:hypothetical protein LCGC14_3075390 [marine sediment metagenome]|uniref:Uncharacterized protein n=1 Tax=marine sediment metagenome TaxID=412755 RepID=A0A0F8WFK5_9ZZZZ